MGLTQTIETTLVTVLLVSGTKAVHVPCGAFMRAGEVKLRISCSHLSCGEHGWVKAMSFIAGLRKATNNSLGKFCLRLR